MKRFVVIGAVIAVSLAACTRTEFPPPVEVGANDTFCSDARKALGLHPIFLDGTEIDLFGLSLTQCLGKLTVNGPGVAALEIKNLKYFSDKSLDGFELEIRCTSSAKPIEVVLDGVKANLRDMSDGGSGWFVDPSFDRPPFPHIEVGTESRQAISQSAVTFHGVDPSDPLKGIDPSKVVYMLLNKGENEGFVVLSK